MKLSKHRNTVLGLVLGALSLLALPATAQVEKASVPMDGMV